MALFNYDPNLFYGGNRAKQTIRITFGMWDYRKEFEVVFFSNISGLDSIRYAVEKILEEQLDDEFSRIVLVAENGDTLTCDDEEDEGDEWLMKMVVKAEIVALEPAGRIFDPIPAA